MVGKTQTKSSLKARETLESVAAAEHSYLKIKNQELAKVLAQTKSEYSQIVAERDCLQKELLSANLKVKKLENCMEIIESSTKSTLNKIVSCSSDITKALQTINLARKITKSVEGVGNASLLHTSMLSNSERDSPSHQTKTHVAVKPMVGGHVILRPTINLRRVNEIPREEIEHQHINLNMQNNSGREEHTTSPNLPEQARQEEDLSGNTSFRCRTTGSYRSPLFMNGSLLDDDSLLDMENEQIQTPPDEDSNESTNSRLQTLQEVDEVSDPSLDVGIPHPNENQSSDGTNPQDVLIGLFTGVQLYACNASQNIPELLGSMTKSLSPHSRSADSSMENLENVSQTQEVGVVQNTDRMPMVTTTRGTGLRETDETSLTLTSFATENHSMVSPDTKGRKVNMSYNEDSSLNETISNKQPTMNKGSPKDLHIQNEEIRYKQSPRNNSTIISGNTRSNRFDASDPLEGPSTLLDDLQTSNITKERRMAISTPFSPGVAPRTRNISSKIDQTVNSPLSTAENNGNKSTPCSPVVVLKRRNAPLKIDETMNKSTSMVENTQNTSSSSTETFTEMSSDETTPQVPKTKKTKAKLNKSKKIVLGNPKVYLKRLVISKRNSLSPEKNRSLRSSSKKSSCSSADDREKSPKRRYRQRTKRSLEKSVSDHELRSSKEQTPKRQKITKTAQSKRNDITVLSPHKVTNSPVNLRRRQVKKSFKEPPLNKKMRRSK